MKKLITVAVILYMFKAFLMATQRMQKNTLCLRHMVMSI